MKVVAKPFEGVLYSTVPPRLILRRDSKWFLLSLPSDRLLVTETEQRPSNFSLLRFSFPGRIDTRASKLIRCFPCQEASIFRLWATLPFWASICLSDASRTPKRTK